MTVAWDNPHASPSPLAPLVDEQRLGSAGGQIATGVAGILLAVVLVVGQISLATTKGIAAHLHASVGHLAEGNEVMESVIERAAPSVQLQKILSGQSKVLANTRDAMVATNTDLQDIRGTSQQLVGVVGGMQTTSTKLATGVRGINTSTATMNETLATLPAATRRTHRQLGRINGDTNAINAELAAIADKMLSYGLPRAKGAPTG